MSKRRKRKITKTKDKSHEASREPESKIKAEKSRTAKKTPSGASKPKVMPGVGKYGLRMIFSMIVVAVVFFIAGAFAGPAISGQQSAVSDEQLIFISPPGCQNCDEMEPMAESTANDLGLPFVKTGFAQQVQNPGFALLYNGTITIGSATDETTFKTIVCAVTEDEELCGEAEDLAAEQQSNQQAEQQAPEIPKADTPEVHAFVMSYCPYGLQFIKAYTPVIELLGDKADLELNFVHYLMHGEKEMDENTRMYCIQKEQSDKFTDYLRCFVDEGDYEGCISEVGIDSGMLDSCIQSADEEFDITKTFEESGDQFPPYKVDETLALEYGVRGSPSFVVNGQVVSVSRSPEAIKEAVCSAFNTAPEECSETLSSAAESPGLGPMGTGSGSDTDAQC